MRVHGRRDATGDSRRGPHNPTAPRTARLFWKQEENESCAPGLKDLQDTVLPSRMFTVGVTKDLVMDDQGFSKCHTHRRTYIRRQPCTVPNRQAICTTEKDTGPHLKMKTLLLPLLLGLACAQLNTVDVSTVGEEDGVVNGECVEYSVKGPKVQENRYTTNCRGNDVNAEDFETFKGLNREKNIPEESMVKIISFGNVTTLHPEYIIY
ncbi:hypothetical protein mRhiFer1_007980 [Rhinolophus ferrumequinum]|uniref:Uncharacterized protein n=1 Tax=Rhinolophus ferrumequinum TaxID=59479 RepID=A0A7J8AVG6_RHIFE|nr:hypothetical protein mRhiFer1_007980 [Rhinolophus ferrumequinum]